MLLLLWHVEVHVVMQRRAEVQLRDVVEHRGRQRQEDQAQQQKHCGNRHMYVRMKINVQYIIFLKVANFCHA